MLFLSACLLQAASVQHRTRRHSSTASPFRLWPLRVDARVMHVGKRVSVGRSKVTPFVAGPVLSTLIPEEALACLACCYEPQPPPPSSIIYSPATSAVAFSFLPFFQHFAWRTGCRTPPSLTALEFLMSSWGLAGRCHDSFSRLGISCPRLERLRRSMFWSKYTDWAMFPHVQYFKLAAQQNICHPGLEASWTQVCTGPSGSACRDQSAGCRTRFQGTQRNHLRATLPEAGVVVTRSSQPSRRGLHG